MGGFHVSSWCIFSKNVGFPIPSAPMHHDDTWMTWEAVSVTHRSTTIHKNCSKRTSPRHIVTDAQRPN
jgi:hypothetical protein